MFVHVELTKCIFFDTFAFMVPFGQAVYLWRMERGLTQEALAQRLGMPRPRLCAIERGAVDPTLRTLRRLAEALGVSPGVLVDGKPPLQRTISFDRKRLERWAAFLVGESVTLAPAEVMLAGRIRRLLSSRLSSALGKPLPQRSLKRRKLHRDWLIVRSLMSREELRALLDRVDKHLQVRGDA